MRIVAVGGLPRCKPDFVRRTGLPGIDLVHQYFEARGGKMLIISNADVAKLLTMGVAIEALDQAYRQLVSTDAVCKPRTDIQIPTKTTGKVYQWSSVEGGSTSGYFAIRMKSDIIYEQE